MTCLSLVNAKSVPYPAGFSYNLSDISVRMYHSSDTNASVFQLKDVDSAMIKPAFEASVLNDYNSHTVFSDKNLNFFEDTGEACKISLYNTKEEKIVSAFIKAKSEYKTSESDWVNFKDLVSPENLRNAWIQLKSRPGIRIQGMVNGALNSIENV